MARTRDPVNPALFRGCVTLWGMGATEHLLRLALSLAQAFEDGEEDPRRIKLPVVTSADAADLVGLMHDQLDDAISHRDAEIGARMACHKGCNACCASPVVVSEGEAVAVVEWLRDHPDVRARFDAKYPKWRETLGPLATAPDPSESRAWTEKVQRAQAMCAFNHEGACSIYPVRPSICRKAHALDTSANCTSLDVPVQYYHHPETEQLYAAQRPMKVGLHHALRRGARLDLLCTAVHRLVGSSTVGRNDPCPCGSGKKHKKCCGA
jgi:Fe-S-cluster containining protein